MRDGETPVPVVRSVGCALPGPPVPQSLVRDLVAARWARHDLERLLPVFDSSRIRTRHFALRPEEYERPAPFAERNARYVEVARALDATAAREALARAGLSTDDVTHLVLASSTGIAAPSLDAHLGNDIGLPPSTRRFPLWGLGCAAGATALGLARDLAIATPDAVVLVVAVEICSLTFLSRDRTKRNLVATALFGDGAAAAVVASSGPGLALGPHRTTTWPRTQRVMGWDLREDGLKVVFSSRIPQIARTRARPALEALRAQVPDWADDEPPAFAAVHPGGPKVLDALSEALGLSERALAPARRVLARCGNMSSPTVLFVLEEILRATPDPPGIGIYAALGPGFTSEMGALRGSAVATPVRPEVAAVTAP
jgi:alkylresorcinol/alkylpyrone synthase